MSEFEDLKKIIRDLLTNRFSPKPNYTRGLLGDGLGNVEVPNKPDHNFARFNRSSTEFFEIPNHTVSPVDGWPILIGELPWQPGVIQVVDTDWSAYQQSGWGNQIGSTSLHSFTHEWPDGAVGSDPVDIYMRAIVPLRGYVFGTGSTSFFANSYLYEYRRTGTTWSGAASIDFSAPILGLVTGQARLMGIYLDPETNALAVITGTIGVFTDAFDPPRPAFPAAVLPVSWLRIYGNQAGLTDRDIRDARQLFKVDSSQWARDAENGAIYPLTLTDKVGIGTETPSEILHISKAQASATTLLVSNTSNDVAARARYQIQNDVIKSALANFLPSTHATLPSWLLISNNATDSVLTMRTKTGGSGSAIDRITILNSEVVINETGVDVDFRVEAIGEANSLFVDGADGDVGIGTDNPVTNLDIDGGIAMNIVAKTTTYIATINDHVITADATGGTFTVTLPALSGILGLILHIKKIDSSGNAVTVDGNSAETIDGELTVSLASQYDNVMLVAGASEWHIL